MNLKLPDVDWQSKNWTIPGQLKKIFEEAGEVAEAVAKDDPVNTVKEALDTIQTCLTMISMMQAEYKMDLNKFIRKHEAKLKSKGYLKG